MIICLTEAKQEGFKYRYGTRKTSRGRERERGTEILLIRSQLRDSSRVDDEGEGVTQGMEREQSPCAASMRARWPGAGRAERGGQTCRAMGKAVEGALFAGLTGDGQYGEYLVRRLGTHQ